jgi:excisionase family DNA binding protein
MRKKAKATEMAEGDQPDQPVVMQKLLTVTDVASILGLSRVKVYELIKRDGLPTLKIDGARRIQPGKLKAWIEQHSE